MYGPHTLVSNLVRWIETRAKLDALYAVFLGCCLSFSSVDAPGILNTDWDGKPQITTRNTAVFQPLSLHMSARLYFHNICQDFSQVCFTSSYPIELVTEISCLLFDISDFCLHQSFTTAHFLHVCFLHCRRRLVTRPSAWDYFRLVPLLASHTIPVMASVPASLVFSYAGCLSVSKRRAFEILYNSTIKLIGIWGLSNV